LNQNPSGRIPNTTATAGFAGILGNDPSISSVFHHSISVSKSGDYKSARPSKTQQHSQNATPSKQRKQSSLSGGQGQQNIVKLAKKKTKNY